MIRKLLLRFCTESQLADALAVKLGDIDSVEVNEKETAILFSDLAKVEAYREYLRDAARKDVLRYFAATTDRERDVIRGAYSRTAFIRSQILKVDEKK